MKLLGAITITAALALAGCGGSSGNSVDFQTAVDSCVMNSNGASRSSCQCATAYAQAHGENLVKLAELEATVQGQEQILAHHPAAVQAAFLCAGR